jgi:L-fuculose-phosphate aldolase
VQHYDAILLANHGVVTCGADLLTAFFRMETVEHFAQVSLMTELLGKQVLLSAAMWKNCSRARALRHNDGVDGDFPAVPSRATTRPAVSGGRNASR